MTTKELQAALDALVVKRQFWRDARAAILSPQTAHIMAGVKARLEAKLADYVDKYDRCSPDDRDTIARCQEGRRICHELISELTEETCNKVVEKLDREIKLLSDEIKTASQSPSGRIGFCET
jgi:hypothetical protein